MGILWMDLVKKNHILLADHIAMKGASQSVTIKVICLSPLLPALARLLMQIY